MVELSHQFHGTTPSYWLMKVLKLSPLSAEKASKLWFGNDMCSMGYLVHIIHHPIKHSPMILYDMLSIYMLSIGIRFRSPSKSYISCSDTLSIPFSLGGLTADSNSLCQVPPIQGPWIQSFVSKWAWVHIIASFVCYIEDCPSYKYKGWLSSVFTRGLCQKYPKSLSRKGLDPDFEFKKLGFVQEACGKQQEEHVVNAQSTVNNARKNSLTAAFNLFATNLTNDQCLQDKFLAMAEMTNSRARSVLIHGLEALGIFWVWWPSLRVMGTYEDILG